MIELENITKKVIKSKDELVILNNINVKFKQGNFYAIMGYSGSGKSTLLNIIGLLDNPTSGIIFLNGIDPLNLTEKEVNTIRLKEIGYVFQECYLSENLNVYENIMMPLLINKSLSVQEKKEVVNELLKMINLQDRANHFPKELSGGERQRIAIARALVNNPRIIIADEPTGNLDRENEQIIFNLLKNLSNIGKCIIVVSHSEKIKEYADEILYMDCGVLKGEKNEI